MVVTVSILSLSFSFQLLTFESQIQTIPCGISPFCFSQHPVVGTPNRGVLQNAQRSSSFVAANIARYRTNPDIFRNIGADIKMYLIVFK
jgi:hypothetical protein